MNQLYLGESPLDGLAAVLCLKDHSSKQLVHEGFHSIITHRKMPRDTQVKTVTLLFNYVTRFWSGVKARSLKFDHLHLFTTSLQANVRGPIYDTRVEAVADSYFQLGGSFLVCCMHQQVSSTLRTSHCSTAKHKPKRSNTPQFTQSKAKQNSSNSTWHACYASAASHLVVSCKPVNARLHKNQAELGITVLAEHLKMLPHGHSLLDHEVQILGNLGSKALLAQYPEDLGTRDTGDTPDTMVVAQNHANLRRSCALL